MRPCLEFETFLLPFRMADALHSSGEGILVAVGFAVASFSVAVIGSVVIANKDQEINRRMPTSSFANMNSTVRQKNTSTLI